jgi:hypothetical protein
VCATPSLTQALLNITALLLLLLLLLQVEGGWNLGGRTPSVWDTFSHAGFIKNNDTGDVACDMYHKYPQDFKLMKELGIKHYRWACNIAFCILCVVFLMHVTCTASYIIRTSS